MKRLLAFLALCLPLYLFAQGFGSFSHDQPFFAVDTSLSSPDLPGIQPVIDFWWYSGDISSNSAVATWNDRVMGFQLIQDNPFYQPTNSSSGVCFDGSKSLDFQTSFIVPTNGSLFVAGYFSTSPHNQIVIYSTNGLDGLFINYTNQMVSRFGGFNHGFATINPSNYMTAGYTMAPDGANTTKVVTYINGVSINTNSYTGTGTTIDLVGGWSSKRVGQDYGELDYSLNGYITDIMVWTNETLLGENFEWLHAAVSTNAETKIPLFDPKIVPGLFSWIRADCPTLGAVRGGPLTNGAPINYLPDGFNPSANINQRWSQGLSSSIWSSSSGPNGKPGMWVTGAGFSYNNPGITYNQPNTYFFVCKGTNSAASPNQCLFDQATQRQAIYTTFTGGKLVTYAGSLMEYIKPDLSTWTIMTVTFNNASSWINTNGVALTATAGSNGTDGLLNPRIGFDSTSANGFQGFLSEFLAYNGTLSTNDIATVENYLRTKYGL